jgi:hypothetical protein
MNHHALQTSLGTGIKMANVAISNNGSNLPKENLSDPHISKTAEQSPVQQYGKLTGNT